MGVHGLWNLVEPVGKPVPLETLENKVLAVDVSIWLHQAVKGFRDRSGNPLPNAHLLGLFHRICKLLFYRIRPVFVFDGAVPELKKKTMANRRTKTQRAQEKANKTRNKLIENFLKTQAVHGVLGRGAVRAAMASYHREQGKDLFELPDLPNDNQFTSVLHSGSDSEEEGDPILDHIGSHSIHTYNFESEEFKSLPEEVQHEILVDLRETRKQSSWAKLNEIPQESQDFSNYQMQRLLKRSKLEKCKTDLEKKIGEQSLAESDLLLDKYLGRLEARKIASHDTQHSLLIKDIKHSLNPSVIDERRLGAESGVIPLETGEESRIYGNSNLTQEEILSIIKSQQDSSNIPSHVNDNTEEFSVVEKPVDHPCGITLEKATSIRQVKGNKKYKFVESYQDKHVRANLDTSLNETLPEFSKDKNVLAKNASERKIASETKNASETKYASETKNVSETTEDCETKNASGAKNSSETKNSSEIRNASETKNASEAKNSSQTKNLSETRTTSASSKVEISSVLNDNLPVIEDESVSENGSKNLEIVIDINKPHIIDNDDLFADIFTDSCDPPCKDRNVDEERDASLVSEASKLKDKYLSPEKAPKNGAPKMKLRDLMAAINKSQSSQEKNRDGDDSIDDVSTGVEHEVTVDLKQDVMFRSSGDDDIDCELSGDLEVIENELLKEQETLVAQRGREERLAVSITDQMYVDAQELLQLFGVPYVIAPMEAEAQCAFLDYISLTQGSITDDSDIWLFGGQRVYKNFFNQNKFVELYQMDDIVSCYCLTRDRLIALALLTGSDYTIGIDNVGPVTAMEFLSEFQGDGLAVLRELKSMWDLLKADTCKSVHGTLQKLKDIDLHPGFPDESVFKAYTDPTVDTSREKFSWAIPNIDELREFARERFGWLQTKTDQMLQPVLKRMNLKQSQMRIDSYFTTHVIPKEVSTSSKRLDRAIKRARGEDVEEEEEKKKKDQRQVKRSREPQMTTLIREDDGSRNDSVDGGGFIRPQEDSLDNSVSSERPSDDQNPSGDASTSLAGPTTTVSRTLIVSGPKRGRRGRGMSNKSVATKKILYKDDIIPQREKDKQEMILRKQRASEILKTKKRAGKGKKAKKICGGKVKLEADLSESSDSD